MLNNHDSEEYCMVVQCNGLFNYCVIIILISYIYLVYCRMLTHKY